MEYRMLGPLEVEVEGPPATVKGRKPRALLALLLLHRNELVPPDLLIDDLWGEKAPATAANTLQVYVSQVRKIVGDRLTTEGGSYRLRVDTDELDAERFERLAEEGASALGRRAYVDAAEQLSEALSLWRGPALADLRYDSFAQGEIARLDELRLGATENRIEADLGLGRHDQVIGELEALIAESPLRERLRGLLMLALYRAGRQADALEAYQAARKTLDDELGLEPGPELRELEQAILRQDEGLSRRPLPAGNVPVPVSTMVGRRREQDEVTAALRGDTRVITLTGPGGSGKTRLSVEVANALADDFTDGAFFVALDAIRDEALLMPAIAETLGVRETGERPLRESLAERLVGRRALVVLDNFEQIVEAAPIVAQVLESVPGLTLLVTSRAALRISGEREYPVDPLDVNDAVALFVDRAQNADPRFTLTEANRPAIEEICARLDYLPLALELAAARTKLLPPEAMLALLDERLELSGHGARDLPDRHQALRDTIAWSYDLLGTDEKELFARLGVFGGGFTLESAVAVCDASLDGIATLIDESLLERDGERMRMLETIREYALEQLAEDEASEYVRRRHAEHFLKLADSEPASDQAAWLARMDAERDNLREALTWSLDTKEASLGLRLAAALWEFWWVRGLLAEGRGWLENALAVGRAAPPELRARALHAAGSLATRQGDYEWAAALFEQSLALSEELGDPSGTARSLLSLGTVAAERGDQVRAIELSERAAELYQESGDRRGHALAVSNLGGIALERGEYAKASELSEQAYGLFETLEDSEGMALALVNQGFSALSEHRPERSLELLRDALRRLAELEFKDVIGYCFEGLAAVLALIERAEEAATLLGAAEALRESLGVELAPAEQSTHTETVDVVRARLGEERFSDAWRQGRELALEQAIAYALEEEGARVRP
ncbi:MAG TPA: BTAD domain-containing putative transcriptional regulator [Gaiellaceae bacterium]